MLTEAHIRYATGTQLASLLGVSPQAVSGWTVGGRHISGYLLHQAAEKGIPKDVLIKGLDLRGKDAQRARRLQSELSEYLESLKVA